MSQCISDPRSDALHSWVCSTVLMPFTILPLAGDASFRRYFRVIAGDQQFVAMDAPPEKENCHPFVAIAKAFEQSKVRLPKIISSDLQQGFLLLSDFGDQQLMPLLQDHSVDALYSSAMTVLLQLQQCNHVPNYDVPHFNDALYWREFELFFTWYIKKHLHKTLSEADENKLRNVYQLLIDSAHAQPSVFVHRDYHSRNIMLCSDGELGILDFQDAVRGPVTYDLVSLLRDCYVAWPTAQVEKWVLSFYEKWSRDNASSVDFNTFLRWFDWMGLQRHLKCLGIFSRLYYRDHKNNYLKEIPRVLNYVTSVCARYPELAELSGFI